MTLDTYMKITGPYSATRAPANMRNGYEIGRFVAELIESSLATGVEMGETGLLVRFAELADGAKPRALTVPYGSWLVLDGSGRPRLVDDDKFRELYRLDGPDGHAPEAPGPFEPRDEPHHPGPDDEWPADGTKWYPAGNDLAADMRAAAANPEARRFA